MTSQFRGKGGGLIRIKFRIPNLMILTHLQNMGLQRLESSSKAWVLTMVMVQLAAARRTVKSTR